MTAITEVNSENFQSEVLDSDTPVLVDFSAVWCAPCKRLDPIVHELAGEWGESVKVVKLDVDHSPDVAGQYQVMGVPTLMLFKGGQMVDRLTGFQPKPRIEGQFKHHLQ